jgi:SpoVK/Ycf46/Vps4 family AAA+-type ATPase
MEKVISFDGYFSSPFDFLTALRLAAQDHKLSSALEHSEHGSEQFLYSCTISASLDGIDLPTVSNLVENILRDGCKEETCLGSSQDESVTTQGTLYAYHDREFVLAMKRYAAFKNGRLDITIGASATSRELLNRLSAIQEALNELSEPEEASVCVCKVFWSDSQGAHCIETSFHCPTWEEIEGNYMLDVRSNIKQLLACIREGNTSGKLILWQGSTGTGKTWAVRALMRELKEKYDFAIITDSNEFCNNISYYYSVIQLSEKPSLLILEDSAESILTETRVHHGHRTSKLLNLTDGLLAQGRQDLFLISFNEPKIEIDPAFTRHGRCLNVTEFTEFEQKDAEKWLKRKGQRKDLTQKKYTLAQLYSVAEGGAVAPLREASMIGFVREGVI